MLFIPFTLFLYLSKNEELFLLQNALVTSYDKNVAGVVGMASHHDAVPDCSQVVVPDDRYFATHCANDSICLNKGNVLIVARFSNLLKREISTKVLNFYRSPLALIIRK